MSLASAPLTFFFLLLSLLASAGSVYVIPLNPKRSPHRVFLSGCLLGASLALFIVALAVVYLGVTLV